MSIYKHLPKSSGLGKLSKAHRKKFAKSQAKRKAKRPVVRERVRTLSTAKRERTTTGEKWHFWGSRQTLKGKDRVVASLRKQGYRVQVHGTGQGYMIYTKGRTSYYS
jgi:6-phosphogluconate dehydrogenase